MGTAKANNSLSHSTLVWLRARNTLCGNFVNCCSFKWLWEKGKWRNLWSTISEANYAKTAIHYFHSRKLHRCNTHRQMIPVFFYWHPFIPRDVLNSDFTMTDSVWHRKRFKWSKRKRSTVSCNISCKHAVFFFLKNKLEPGDRKENRFEMLHILPTTSILFQPLYFLDSDEVCWGQYTM